MAWQAPNAWLVAAFAALAGGGIGAASAALQASLRPWQVGGFRPGVTDRTAPRAEADETVHAFGTMPAGGGGSHVFHIRNSGAAPLTLTRGASSCSCTIGGFSGADGTGGVGSTVVPPGESTPVTVRWTGKGRGPFRQQVTILTDDPRRPEIPFVVEGAVLPSWKPLPATIVLPRVSAKSGAAGGVAVFTYGAQAPVVKSLTIDHPEAEARFALSTSPLAATDLAAEPGATGGFLIEVQAKPGLPPGRLRQTVTVVFDMGEEVTAELPLEGIVASDLLITGPGWDSDRQALILGTVSGAAGRKTRLFLTVKGEHRDAVRPEVREVVPASLVVSVGEPAPVGSSGSLRIPLEIAVPPGSRPANHLCSQSGPPGRIVLATAHPEAPTLTIPVCIAIGP
jgi:hypothetical protein